MFSEQSKVKITLYQDNRREPLENLFKNPQQFRPHQIIKQQLSDVESLRRAHLPSDKQGALAIQKHLSPIINLSQWFKPQTNTNQQDKLITLTLDCEITINQKKSVWKDQYKSELEQAINTYMYSNLATYYDSGFAKDPYHILINHIHAYQEAFYSYIRSREHFNEVAFALMETLKAIKPTEIQIWVPTPVNQSRRYYFYFSPIQKLWQNWLFKALIFIFMDVLHRTTIDKFLDKYLILNG